MERKADPRIPGGDEPVEGRPLNPKTGSG